MSQSHEPGSEMWSKTSFWAPSRPHVRSGGERESVGDQSESDFSCDESRCCRDRDGETNKALTRGIRVYEQQCGGPEVQIMKWENTKTNVKNTTVNKKHNDDSNNTKTNIKNTTVNKKHNDTRTVTTWSSELHYVLCHCGISLWCVILRTNFLCLFFFLFGWGELFIYFIYLISFISSTCVFFYFCYVIFCNV